MNNLSAAAATDQIFAPRPGSLCLSGCNSQSFASLRAPADDLEPASSSDFLHLTSGCCCCRCRGKKIARIPSAHVGWGGHEKSIKTRVLIEILTTNDRGRVRLICQVMLPNWLQLRPTQFPIGQESAIIGSSGFGTNKCSGHIWHFSTGHCFRILRIPLSLHPRPNIKYQQPHCCYLLPNLEILMFLILTN